MNQAQQLSAMRDVFVLHSAEFSTVIGDNPRLVKIVDVDAHEGPVYKPDEDALYFTSLPQVTDVPAPGTRRVLIKRVQLQGEQLPLPDQAVTVVQHQTHVANGMTLDREGWLVVCEQGSHTHPARISRIHPATGDIETVVDQWRGLRFNSPNDVVVKSDGTIWFTDPSYGYLQGFRPQPMVGDYVYRHDPRSGQTRVVADAFVKPNGLAFSPDETVLYITDSGANQEAGSYYVDQPHHILAFDVRAGRQLVNQRLFAVITPGFPDGIKVDAAGNVYASAFSGVQVFNPEGDLIGEILLPGTVNFTFGGREDNLLFITTDEAIWAAHLQAKGTQRPSLTV